MSRVPAHSRGLGRRGVAAVEFAFIAPVLVLLGLGCADIMTMLRAQLRIETAAVQLGQIVSQCLRVTTTGDTNQLFAHGQSMVGNLGIVTGNIAPRGAIVITAVRNVSGQNRVAWQIRDGSLTHSSTVASGPMNAPAPANTAAVIAGGFIVPPDETLIVTEIVLQRQALILRGQAVGIVLPDPLRANTLFLSRSADALAVQALTVDANRSCTA
jgi:Flp pilus assembly protein TadG